MWNCKSSRRALTSKGRLFQQVSMGTDALVRLLSGTTTLAPPMGRASLSVLMAMRLAALVVEARNPRCRLACFDSTLPVSPFTLFLLQTAFVTAHGLACSYLGRPPDCQGKGWRRNQTQQLCFHLLSVLSRILLEGLFLMTFYALYVRYPRILHCPALTSCPDTVACTIRYTQWKDAFDLFVASTSWASVAICLMVLYFAVTETVQFMLWPADRHLGQPLLVESV